MRIFLFVGVFIWQDSSVIHWKNRMGHLYHMLGDVLKHGSDVESGHSSSEKKLQCYSFPSIMINPFDLDDQHGCERPSSSSTSVRSIPTGYVLLVEMGGCFRSGEASWHR
jgi:hypothetical protein